MILCSFRNGFGLDIENVYGKPVFGMYEDDEVGIVFFDGLVFKAPFFVVYWGKLMDVDDL